MAIDSDWSDGDRIELKLPFGDEVKAWVKKHARYSKTDDLAMIMVIAELTDNEPDSVRARYDTLKTECARVYYEL